MKRAICFFWICFSALLTASTLSPPAGIWMQFETVFLSGKSYDNPLYDVRFFEIRFTSPSGRTFKRSGFWDGGNDWKVRFCPDELGTWTYRTSCSDTTNEGLHRVSGSFECIPHNSNLAIYTKGAIVRPKGYYHLAHADGTPFFWAACTAWNGALLSTDDEWEKYLTHRASHGYSAIQFVTTQWRGCAANRFGEVAFEGSGRIRLNVDFFKHLDAKVDRINAHGLVAAPVLLWALPVAQSRELSPGYFLPEPEAILLARYTVARYGGHHVVWFLGGDGKYVDEYEQRWKTIGRGVFGDEHPGVVSQHPMGRSWIGSACKNESWLDVIGYQSSHSNAQSTVDWITKGPAAREWDKLPARPIINLEPNYEQIGFRITDRDVRNASAWSLLAAPVAGITYGANGIWPWLRPGDRILNHGDAPGTSPWYESIDFPGSIQIGYLADFFRKLEWWRFRPAQELLVVQPGDQVYNHFISVARTDNGDAVLAYLPVQASFELFNPKQDRFQGEWFDPVENRSLEADLEHAGGRLRAASPKNQDMFLLLKRLPAQTKRK